MSSSLTSRTIPYFFFTISYAVVAELADALSSGGSGVIRESSNLSNRTNLTMDKSHRRMRFFTLLFYSCYNTSIEFTYLGAGNGKIYIPVVTGTDCCHCVF